MKTHEIPIEIPIEIIEIKHEAILAILKPEALVFEKE